MKVSTKKKASETLSYLEELGLLIWELNQATDDNKVKEITEKMKLCYTVCAKNLKDLADSGKE